MNILNELILTSDFVAGPTPPTNFKSEPWEAWLNGFLILTIVLIIFIIFLCCLLYQKNKSIKSLEKKICPILVTNNETKDIILISNDDYTEVAIQFAFYDENKILQKQYILKETNLETNEQRKIGNVNDLGKYIIEFKIDSFTRKEE